MSFYYLFYQLLQHNFRFDIIYMFILSFFFFPDESYW